MNNYSKAWTRESLWPRQHAYKLLSMKSKEARLDYLNNEVPEELREWVKHYVKLWWPRRSVFINPVK